MTPHAALRAQALAARAAADPNRAAQAWRALLDAAPHDWALGLELRQDLLTGLHDPDHDPRFRRAAAFLPDAEWLDHYAPRQLFHGADLSAIDARARQLLGRHPQDLRLQTILGHVARQRRDWPEAARAFSAAGHTALATHARLYARLAAQPWPGTGPGYRLLALNLDRNGDRLAELQRQFADSPVPLERIAATEGVRLPGAAAKLLTGSTGAPRGTLGCFLGHAAAWEALLQSDAGYALVVEDDAIPLLRLPPTLGGLGLPDAWDVVWVNDRMEPGGNPDAVQAVASVPVASRMFPADQNAIGTDGYLISRAGARKLLDWTARDGLAENADWRMLAYALTPAEIAAIPQATLARTELDRLARHSPRADRLQAHVLRPALIRSVSVSSDREDQDRGDWP